MDSKDYLQLAKDDLDYSHGCRREYEDQILDAAQAQAAALIAIAGRLDRLIAIAEGLDALFCEMLGYRDAAKE